ncbi:MAG: hypothetical protein P4L62_02355 [Candidatus Pacebacteria bacterium]|nr:hypothetical protein [Candidatus Paceibacterota bacterium]
MIGHRKLNAGHYNIVSGIVVALKGLDLLNRAFFQKPLDKSGIHGISGQSVYFPTQNAVIFSAFEFFHHLIENRTPGLLGGFGFLQNLHNVEIFPFRDFLHLKNLRLNRKSLPVF